MKALILAAALAAPLPAAAQGWEVYSYADDKVAVQLPAAPTVSKGTYRTAAGASVPATTYALKQVDAAYSLTVATIGQGDKDTVIAGAVKALSGAGEVKIDVEARIDREYGRSLSLFGKDGSRSLVSVFFVGGKLYELEGKALPPRPELASGKTLRFQQSLDFLDPVAVANRPENRAEGPGGPGGAGGPGGPGLRRPPPPRAFEDCRGKTLGEAVRHTLPAGATVAATCVQTPRGLAARPDLPPPGGPRG